MSRLHNFSAGPAVLPETVLRTLQEDIWEFNDAGVGLLECSHRSKDFDEVIDETRARLRRLLHLDDDQEVLFLHGGARTQFFMIPMNLLNGGRAAYLDTGTWASQAAEEARRFGHVDVLFSGKDSSYDRVPEANSWELTADTKYLHYTSNNTVAGTEFHYTPEVPCWLFCDASSDFLAREIDGSKFDILYGGAQKNLGPAGVTLCIIRRSLLETCDENIPTMLRYGIHVAKQSMFNTPCTFAIHAVGQVCKWIEENGGIGAIETRNRSQANRVYSAIDASGLYRGKVQKNSRSLMNCTFTTDDPELDTRFHLEAAKAGISGLKGHKSVGGLRASIYNAQRDEAVDALIEYMREFERVRG
jgi:phosphoserine aminotransferase